VEFVNLVSERLRAIAAAFRQCNTSQVASRDRWAMVSIVATLSALYPVVTVALAVTLLGERPTRAQLGGGALALAGATLIAVRAVRR